MSLLGKIGERLQITANYDTESTFDFQNLVKIQFNPPKISELQSLDLGGIPGNLGNQIERVQEGINQIQNSVDEVKGLMGEGKNGIEQARQKIQNLRQTASEYAANPFAAGDRVAQFLNGTVTEDAILQNIDIGNISMPINSNLIQGAQSFGVRADLKFGNTTISTVFSEQRSQSQNITTQGGVNCKNLICMP